MKVMVIVKATRSSEAGEMPSRELLTAMGNFNEQLVKAGIMLDGAGLQPSSRGARVHFRGTGRTVIDGPFAETKELIAGFWIWRVDSLHEAIEWVKRCPNPMAEESDIEIRPLFEAEDFGESFSPELREQEAAVRAATLGLHALRFENHGELLVAGSNQSYTYENRSQIPSQWERFMAQIAQLPGLRPEFQYGICWNVQKGTGFDYLTGVEVSDDGQLSPGFTSIRLPASRYAVFPVAGHVSDIPNTIERIWNNWAPDCGLAIAHTPCFERYTPAFDPHTGTGGMEIWIPLRS